MTKQTTLDDSFDALEDRVEGIEDLLKQLLDTSSSSDKSHSGHAASCCAMPEVPPRPRSPGVSEFRERLIAYTQKKWVNGTRLRYYFFTRSPLKGHASNVKMVREAFHIWKDLGIGLEFEETKDISEAELRISFQQGIGSWSYVGTDNLRFPKQNEPTMNFGWDLRHDSRGVDTPLHEIGHALGFPHEHQNPFAGIVWDEQEVIRNFSGPPNNWDLATIRHNILNKHSSGDVQGSDWDPDSVMHYGFGPGLILSPSKYQNGLTPAPGLSAVDKSEVLKFYPPLHASDIQELAPMVADILDATTAEQVNYIIRPEETRDYTLRSIGASDTLLVLFRQDEKKTVYVQGSDDGGLDTNAEMAVRLERGQEYLLRARRLSDCGEEKVAIIYW